MINFKYYLCLEQNEMAYGENRKGQSIHAAPPQYIKRNVIDEMGNNSDLPLEYFF